MLLTLGTLRADPAATPAGRYFKISVVDKDTGRGVPLVELRTTNGVSYFTDSRGVVAFDEPGLAGQRVYFHVSSHGYKFPKDGFGYRGKALVIEPGGSAELVIERRNIAERLYRVTGGGIYRDTLLLGEPAPLAQPALNAQVFGSDSVVNAVYRGRIHWFWGDTHRPSYPLGNFHVPGATSKLPADGGLDPAIGVDLQYYVDEHGFARPTCRMPGDGPTWLDGLVTLKDAAGQERLCGAYVKVHAPLSVYARGMAVFDDEQQQFEKVADVPLDAPLLPGGHPLTHAADGRQHVYFAQPYPLVRVPATVEDYRRLENYEAYTCLSEGTSLKDAQLDRTADGTLRYAWKRNTPAVGPAQQQELIRAGKLRREEALLQLVDRDSGKPVTAHGGSVYWNGFRNRFVMITVEQGGTSFLGEVWYAEADTPLGSWVYATKIVTHDNYSFYNPKQHPMFDADGGRSIFFEGTYTHTFSGNKHQTPRYDYNQIMYRLNLSDERLALPVALYRDRQDGVAFCRAQEHHRGDVRVRDIAFFALDRPGPASLPIVATQVGDSWILRALTGQVRRRDGEEVHFYALPIEMKDPPPTTAPLFEFVGPNAQRFYSIDERGPDTTFVRQPEPLCRVWRNPYVAALGDRD